MFLFKAIFCRVFQTAFRMVLPVLPYREPEIVHSCGELDRIFKKEQIHSALIVTDEGIVSHGLTVSVEAVLERSGVACAIYDKTQPNPTVSNVEEALALYRAHGCDSLIAIGGGSSMDCAKAVGARVAHPHGDPLHNGSVKHKTAPAAHSSAVRAVFFMQNLRNL